MSSIVLKVSGLVYSNDALPGAIPKHELTGAISLHLDGEVQGTWEIKEFGTGEKQIMALNTVEGLWKAETKEIKVTEFDAQGEISSMDIAGKLDFERKVMV